MFLPLEVLPSAMARRRIVTANAQLPPGLARWLSDQGYSAQHVDDIGLAGAEDSVIWNHALRVDAIIVTKDEDFADGPHEQPLGR